MMHAVYIHIDELLRPQQLRNISSELSRLPYITDVEVNERVPHDLMVEYQPSRGYPMAILNRLHQHGLHADIMSC